MPLSLIIAIIENLPQIIALGEEGVKLVEAIIGKTGGTQAIQDAHQALTTLMVENNIAPYDAPGRDGG